MTTVYYCKNVKEYLFFLSERRNGNIPIDARIFIVRSKHKSCS
jgi:hypothetical protein